MPQVIMMRAIQMSSADLHHDEVARYFRDEITKKEEAGTNAERCRSETDVLVHGQRGKADVDAI